jgi:hypothetical protein
LTTVHAAVLILCVGFAVWHPKCSSSKPSCLWFAHWRGTPIHTRLWCVPLFRLQYYLQTNVCYVYLQNFQSNATDCDLCYLLTLL